MTVLAGVCTDCGAAAPHAAVHESWHEEQTALLRTFAAAEFGIVRRGDRVLVTVPYSAELHASAVKDRLEELFPGVVFVILQGPTDVKVVHDDSEAAAQA